MTEEITHKIKEYVYKNYGWLKNKNLVIREKKNCFHISAHEDASPLILGKKMFTNE